MRKGFTLIELLIVIMVIAILIGIALPRFRGMQDEASTAKAAAELRTLQTAVESWYIHSSPHAYPAVGGTWETPLTAASVSPRIIGAVLLDPFGSGGQYGYSLSPLGKYYVIWSVGPDGSGALTVDNDGAITGADDDDIFVSNGTSGTGGF